MSLSQREIRVTTPRLCLALLALWSALALAEPPVIYDSGKTRPISDFVSIPESAAEPTVPALPSGADASAQFLAALFPIETPEMTPGPVVSAAINLPIPQPFFLVGSDPLSRQWLVTYRDKLAQIGAVGLVVNVPTVQDYQALQDLAGEAIQLTPAAGTDFLHVLQGVTLNHYPVLISGQRIEQ